MYLIYALALILLLAILLLLLAEERRLQKNITHGLASKFWVLREKRRFIRFNEELKIRYSLAHRPPVFHDSKTSNVSRKGLCVITYEKLKKNMDMVLEIDMQSFSRPIQLMARVMWAKELPSSDDKGRRLFYTGVKFSRISPEYEAMLLTHLNSLKPY
ncbi:MAG: PilZ domain-containing protein [Candidatus Omnitrophota bacterium]